MSDLEVFRRTWDGIYGARFPWSGNPVVYRVEFEVVSKEPLPDAVGGRGILFTGPLVVKILNGQKTVTRRPVKPADFTAAAAKTGMAGLKALVDVNPYGKPGDYPYVREAWKIGTEMPTGGAPELVYRADGGRLREFPTEPVNANGFDPLGWATEVWVSDFPREADTYHEDMLPWHPGIHLPKWASRLWLRIRSVSAEPLQDMPVGDVALEGVGVA